MIISKKHELESNGKIMIKIRVCSNANKTALKEKMSDGTFKMDVKAVPEKGKANQEIVKYLQKKFVVEKQNVKIISGRTNKNKFIKIWKKKK